ncbi:UNVERIFIED_CONTAM: hypothetical protein NCL1_12625 [Trichonephila clavipes]
MGSEEMFYVFFGHLSLIKILSHFKKERQRNAPKLKNLEFVPLLFAQCGPRLPPSNPDTSNPNDMMADILIIVI